MGNRHAFQSRFHTMCDQKSQHEHGGVQPAGCRGGCCRGMPCQYRQRVWARPPKGGWCAPSMSDATPPIAPVLEKAKRPCTCYSESGRCVWGVYGLCSGSCAATQPACAPSSRHVSLRWPTHFLCHLPHVTRHTPHATCHTPHATCRTPHATRHLPHATRHLPTHTAAEHRVLPDRRYSTVQ